MIQHLREFTYTAGMANLDFTYEETFDFIQLKFEGYQSNIEEFISSALNLVKSFDPTKMETLFDTLKELWSQDKNEFYYKKPVKQCYQYLDPLLSHMKPDEMELMDNEEKMTFKLFLKMNQQFLKRAFM